jgi:outer membrane protein assembly factor BamB
VFTTTNKLNVLDSSNGAPLWEYPLAFDTVFTSQNTAPIIDASQNIYFGGKDSYLYSINSITRIFNWRFRNPTVTPNNQLSIPVIGLNSNIYYGDMVGNVYDLSGNDSTPIVTVPIVSMFMLNSAHSGISTYPNGIITPVTRSTYTDTQFVCNNLYILPGIAIDQSGVLYIGSDNGYLYAIRSNSPNPTMTLKWKKLLTATTPTPQVEKNLYTTPVAAPNGSIYVGSSEGILYAIDPSGATGTIKWQFNAGFRFQSSPIIDEFGTLYFGAGTRLYAMNDVGYQGYLKWFQPFEASGNILSSPALDASGTLYFGTDHDDGYVYAVNSTTGLAKWAAPTATNQPIFSSPTTDSSNNVIIGNGSDHGGNLYYLDTVDGHIRWTMQDLSGTNGPFYNTVAVLQNTIYLSTICGVYAINRQTGVRERTFQSTYYYYTAPTLDASGTIYVGAVYAGTDPAELNAGYLLALTDDGTTITSKWIYKVATRGRMAPPVISNDGNIYISSTDNRIYAIKNST